MITCGDTATASAVGALSLPACTDQVQRVVLLDMLLRLAATGQHMHAMRCLQTPLHSEMPEPLVRQLRSARCCIAWGLGGLLPVDPHHRQDAKLGRPVTASATGGDMCPNAPIKLQQASSHRRGACRRWADLSGHAATWKGQGSKARHACCGAERPAGARAPAPVGPQFLSVNLIIL